MMDLEQFWSLIEKVCERCAGPGKENAFIEVLDELSPEHILQFNQRLSERSYAAYHWDIWGALHIIEDGSAGDDKFEEFRTDLILHGREVFEAALRDADSLAELKYPPTGVEDLTYIPYEVYKRKTGVSFPDDYDRPPHPNRPAGEPWEEDDLPTRLPRLWKVHGGATEMVRDSTQSLPREAGSSRRIRVTNGPFEGYEGHLVEADDTSDRVVVVLDVFGRPMNTEVQRSDIELLD